MIDVYEGDMLVQVIQESVMFDKSDVIDNVTDTVEQYQDELFCFIKTNKDKIKEIYNVIKSGKVTKMVPDVVDITGILNSYNEYLDSMLSYFKEITDSASKFSDDANGKLSEKMLMMQKKDCTFFDTLVCSEEVSISDAMKNIEIIEDFKKLLDEIQSKFNSIESGVVDANIEKQIMEFYSKSVATFCYKTFDTIEKTFKSIVSAIDADKKEKEYQEKNKNPYVLLGK